MPQSLDLARWAVPRRNTNAFQQSSVLLREFTEPLVIHALFAHIINVGPSSRIILTRRKDDADIDCGAALHLRISAQSALGMPTALTLEVPPWHPIVPGGWRRTVSWRRTLDFKGHDDQARNEREMRSFIQRSLIADAPLNFEH